MLFNFLTNLFLSSMRINITSNFVLQLFSFTCRTSSRIHLQILFRHALIGSVPNNRFTYRRPLNANACFFRTLSELISLLCALKKLHTHPIFPFRFHTLSSELFRISVNSNSSAASYFDELSFKMNHLSRKCLNGNHQRKSSIA